MIVELEETTASKIMAALLQARRSVGSPALGMVLSLVLVTEEEDHETAMDAALHAAKEHPSRVIGVVSHPDSTEARLDATLSIGEGVPGESVLLRMHGELAQHTGSVVTPLLLPESPVVVWWAGHGPESPSTSPIGRLATRRITDGAGSPQPRATLIRRCAAYAPGDTDLTWTRTTSWRGLLAAALDQCAVTVTGAVVEAETNSGSAALTASWLSERLQVPTSVRTSDGPGITACRLDTERGEIAITRPAGGLARYEIPGQPARTVALKRRETSELLAEEMRHLDPDEVYAETAFALSHRGVEHDDRLDRNHQDHREQRDQQ